MLPQPLPCCLYSSGRLLSLRNPVLQQCWAESCRLRYPPGLSGVGILAITGRISSTWEHLPSQAGSVQAAQPDDLVNTALLEQSAVSSLLEICQWVFSRRFGSPALGVGVLSPFLRGTVYARAGCAAPGAGMLHGIPGRTVPKFQVCDRCSSQHSISEMNLWHNLSETLLLQARGIPQKPPWGSGTPSSLMTDIFLSWTMGKGCAGSQNSYKKWKLVSLFHACHKAVCTCFLWFWKGNKGWRELQHA